MITYEVSLESGLSVIVQAGTTAGNILRERGGFAHPLVAALVDNELKPLGHPISMDCRLAPVLSNSALGALVYRRSLCFLLAKASRSVFPKRRLMAGMAIGAGFYHYYLDGEALDEKDIAALRRTMLDLVSRSLPIEVLSSPWEEAKAFFASRGQMDTLELIEQVNEPAILLNCCEDFQDLHVIPLVDSTSLLGVWELRAYHGGLLLRYPHKDNPQVLEPFEDVPLLYRISEEYRERGRVLGTGSVGRLNRLGAEGRIKEFIQVAEALQNRRLASIAEAVAARGDRVRLVLIAGPSSSGKTTTSKKLAVQLKVLGLKPIPLELDDFFVDRAKTPVDAEGKPDFESLQALDIELLNAILADLLSGKEVELPRYDFKTGARRWVGSKLRLAEGDMLILEGIHGLNEALTPLVSTEEKFKIYVSALTQMNLDDHNRISTTDYRLLRRMVRDNSFRGHSARSTLAMWPSVQKGERRYIFPFQNSADEAFNSALDYELGVLKVFADPLLKSIKPDMAEYAEARRIQAFMEAINPIPAHHVPKDSILREFIGESDFA
ncbi:MAG TPA: nucleoside kinase [Rectinemataceae bacterium]